MSGSACLSCWCVYVAESVVWQSDRQLLCTGVGRHWWVELSPSTCSSLSSITWYHPLCLCQSVCLAVCMCVCVCVWRAEKGAEIQAMLAEVTGQKTVPNVFISGQHIGQLLLRTHSIIWTWMETWVVKIASQYLHELILTWEWVLCSCNNFHAECI